MPDPVIIINHAARSRARGMRPERSRSRLTASLYHSFTPLLSPSPAPALLPSQAPPRTGPRHATRLLAHTTRSTRDKKQLHRSRSFRSIEEGKEEPWVPRSRRSRLERLFGPSRWYIVEGRRGIGLGVGERAEERAVMGRLFLMHLEGSVYSCKHCKTHLGLAGDIISKSFRCKHGKAYLFNKVVNVTNGVKEDRLMMTGMHTVSDIFCVGCGSIVGWKYEAAHEKIQRYKEGKFILERYKVSGPDGSSSWATHDAHLGGSDADDV